MVEQRWRPSSSSCRRCWPRWGPRSRDRPPRYLRPRVRHRAARPVRPRRQGTALMAESELEPLPPHARVAPGAA
eukprot:4283547-Alexandrium_andersonii.AAC.1